MEGGVRDIVFDLKYRGIRALAPNMGELLARHLESSRLAADLIVPVPLHVVESVSAATIRPLYWRTS